MALICFDWDGTIADSWPVYKKSVQDYCLDKKLYVPTENEMKMAFGNTNWGGIPQWGENFQEQDKVRFGTYNSFYEYLKDMKNLTLIDGIENLILKLKKKNVMLAVITSRPKEPLLEALNHHKLNQNFDFLFTRECANEKGLKDKPAADMIEYVMKHLDKQPDETIMIGDTEMDIQMAHSAKCKSIGVTWGMRNKSELEQTKPSYICSESIDLEDKIRKLL